MLGMQNAEVLVVGAGPVGLLTALNLARRGIRVQIVDKEWRPGAHSYALALHAATLGLLEELGLRQRVLQAALPIRRVAFYDDAGQRRGQMGLPGGEHECLAVMRQDAFERLLEDALRQLGIDVLWNHEVARLAPDGDLVAATINTLTKDTVGYAVAHTEWVVAGSTEVRLPYVIGADGHRSLVRRLMGIEFATAGPTQHFAVFEFKSSTQLGDEMRLVFGEQTSDVLWPLGDGYCRFSFEQPGFSVPATSRTKTRVPVQIGAGRYPVLSEENLHALLAERAPWFSGDIQDIRWRIAVRFERRLAGAFGRERMWLAGDAGHITGPAGMQSMNVGLREARDLAGILAGILRKEESPDALQRYNRERLAEWRFLLGLQGGLAPGAGADAWVSQHAAGLLPCIPAAGADLATLAEQIGLSTV